MYVALGQTRPLFTTCPHCSILKDGECVICPEGDPHPSCEGCIEGRLPPPPWYQHELVYAIGTAVAVSVASTILITYVGRKLDQAKAAARAAR